MSAPQHTYEERWPSGRQLALVFSLLTAVGFMFWHIGVIKWMMQPQDGAVYWRVRRLSSPGLWVGILIWTAPIWVYLLAIRRCAAAAASPLGRVCGLANLVLIGTWVVEFVLMWRLASE